MNEDEASKKRAQELAERLMGICEEYTIEEVSSATFSIMMSAIDENEEFSEKQSTLAVVLTEVSKAYNELVIEAHRPANLPTH